MLSHSAFTKLEEAAHDDGYGAWGGLILQSGFPCGWVVARTGAVEGGELGRDGVVEVGLEEGCWGLGVPFLESGFELVCY